MDGEVVRQRDNRDVASSFAARVLRSRHAAWMTQEELAEKSGLSARSIQDIERGRVRRPRRDTVRLLADALDLRGVSRREFEAAARPRSDSRAEPLGQCLARRLGERNRTQDVLVDLHGLGRLAEPATVLARLLAALDGPDVS